MRYYIKLSIKTILALLGNPRNLQRWILNYLKKTQNPPIFIVGCGHSGTSLLLAILDTHSRIYAVPNETGLAYDYASDQPRPIKGAKLLLCYLNARAIQSGKMRWVEKTPKHICAIGTLLRLRPNARIIIVIRDGRDVAASLYKRHKDLRQGIESWANDNRAGETYWNHPNVCTVRYENLIVDFAATMRKIMDFLGEEYEVQLSQYYKTARYYYSDKIEKPCDESDANHDAYRNWQINQPLFDGRGKWKTLREDEKQIIKDIAGDMLIEYGYAKNKDW